MTKRKGNSAVPSLQAWAEAAPPTKTCLWPLWGDREPISHQYCGEPTAEIPGISYCPAHVRMAHRPAAPPRFAGEEHRRRADESDALRIAAMPAPARVA